MALVFDTTQVPFAPARSAAGDPAENTGQSSPIGATIAPGGVNFSLFSRSASNVELLFFDRENDALPSRVNLADIRHSVTFWTAGHLTETGGLYTLARKGRQTSLLGYCRLRGSAWR